jgi:hypothetical protein
MLVTSVAITDANGGYVLKDVPPGRYYVGAGPLETPTYAPGSSSPAGATLVVMTAGAALKVGDFRLRETPRKVSGLVIREKRHAAGTKVVLENPLLKLTAAIGRENNFTFPEVPPGIYEVGVSPDVGPLGISVVVGDKDLKLEVPIPLSAVTSVYVGIRVVVEDYPKIPWPKLQLKLVPTGAVALTAPAPRTIAVTGAIRIQLPVGQYFAESVLSEPLPDGYTIKWMLSEHDGRERPTEALTQPLVVTPTVKSIAIVIVKKGTDPE